MTELMKMWEVEQKHRGHWFDPASKRFFSSRVDQTATVKDGKAYFTSSEQFDCDAPRLYSVRVCDLTTGDIDTVGEFQQYETASQARRAIKQLAG